MTATQSKPSVPVRSNSRAIVPTDSGLLIRKLESDEQTASGIYLPQKQKERDETARAEVVSVGPGRLNPDWPNKREPMECKPCDRIIYRLHAGTPVIHQGEELFIIDASEVVCREVSVL